MTTSDIDLSDEGLSSYATSVVIAANHGRGIIRPDEVLIEALKRIRDAATARERERCYDIAEEWRVFLADQNIGGARAAEHVRDEIDPDRSMKQDAAEAAKATP